MSIETLNVRESKEIDEKINSIVINYLQLMIDCAKDDNVRQDFINNPHPYLDKVGMTVPKNVKVILDEKIDRWPAMTIRNGNEEILIEESHLSYGVSNGKKENKVELKKTSEVKLSLDFNLENCDEAVVRLPFFEDRGDLLTIVNFKDNAEVILSCC